MLKHSNKVSDLSTACDLCFILSLFSFFSRLFEFPTLKKALEERLHRRKLLNRQADRDRDKLWEPRKQSRVFSKHVLNRKPTETYPYPTEKLDYTSTFKQKKKRKTFVRQEST